MINTKIKLGLFLASIALLFLASGNLVKAQNNSYACGSGDQGTCKSGSFICPDGWNGLSGGRSCDSGFKCCIENVEDDVAYTNKSLQGEYCGAGNVGTCMQASLFMCPTGYTTLYGGRDCSGASLKCCVADSGQAATNTNQSGNAECQNGQVYDSEKNGCVPAKTPGQGDSRVQPISEIKLPGNFGLPSKSVKEIAFNMLTWLLEIVGVLALMGFIVSGIQYLMAYANEDLAEKAKKNFTYSIIGITIVLASFVIIQAIQFALESNPWF